MEEKISITESPDNSDLTPMILTKEILIYLIRSEKTFFKNAPLMTIFKKKTIITFISCSLLLFLIAGVFTYRKLAIWLFLADPLPENLNYICTFAGSSDREPYSIELLQIFKDAVWVVSTNNSQLKILASQNRIDSNRIIITPKCNSTLEEINSFKEIINRIENASGSSNKPLIGLVSSPYHMRRI